MLSCDTFAARADATENGQNFFAKNSDRPPGEAQPLRFFPAADHAPGTLLACSEIEIPQAPHTYAVIGAQPYWIWGFEMGLNECGVVIGNEAEGSNEPSDPVTGLLGMDLLRLGLERGATAYEAMHVIIDLLQAYGQNANAHPSRDRRYENSYMIVDRNEIWLLETAGRRYAARRIDSGTAAISNCYSIGTEFDECSDDLASHAVQQRWIRPDVPFDFARAYTKPAPRQAASVPRYRRLQKLLAQVQGRVGFETAQAVLRDHFDGELIAPRFGAAEGTFTTICMHAMSEDNSQTAASLLTTYDAVLGPVSRYCPSTPCTSVYLPVYWTGSLPACMQAAGATYAPDSLWWTVERLGFAVHVDSDRFAPQVRPELDALEATLQQRAREVEAQATALYRAGKDEDAKALLNALMADACAQLQHTCNALYAQLTAQLRAEGGLYGGRAATMQAYADRVGFAL